MITLKMDVGGVTHDLQLLASNLKSLKTPLKEISKAKQVEVQSRFAANGPGWTPLKPESQRKHAVEVARRVAGAQGYAVNQLAQRIGNQLKNAIKRADMGKTVKESTYAQRQLEQAVLGQARFARDISGSSISRELRAKVEEKLFRRALSIQSKRNPDAGILGRIARSITARIDDRDLVLMSVIPWSGVHNEGGTAGKGAKIPGRVFLEWTDSDLQNAVEAFERHMMKGING